MDTNNQKKDKDKSKRNDAEAERNLDISWFEKSHDKTPAAFFEHFGILQCEEGHRRYSRVLRTSDMNKQDRTLLISKFATWKKSEGRIFWERGNAEAVAEKSAWKTAGNLIEGSEPFAGTILTKNARKQRQRSALENFASSGQLSEKPPVRELGTNEAVQAGQKRLRDPFDNESISQSRNRPPLPSDVDKGDRNENETDIMDVVTDEEVVDDDDDETVDFEDESIESMVNELEELIQKSKPGFHPLIRALYYAVRNEPFQKPRVIPDLSESQAFLYSFVWERLEKFTTLRPIEQKDIFVAISGIVDLDVHKMYPNRDERMTDCRNVLPQHEGLDLLEKYKAEFVIDDGDDVLEADLTELKAGLERDLSKFRDGTDEKMVIEILLLLVKLSLPDIFKRPKATETSTLFVWHSIWQTLFSQTAVSVQVGETILKEARVDQLLVRQIVGPRASKSAKSASGRRLDFRLTACIQSAVESISVTLCNNEHKAPSVSQQTVELQHRKNTRLNKSILTRGSTPSGMHTLFCDVVGLEGRMYALRPFKDVWLSCEVKESIKLPTNSFEMGTFLFNNQLNTLLAYRKHTLSLARRCQGFASKPPFPKTPSHSPSLLPTFYTPTSPRTKDVL
ncbi:hypothetical protein BGX27_001266, partial [Mortierella sp. AM989]